MVLLISDYCFSEKKFVVFNCKQFKLTDTGFTPVYLNSNYNFKNFEIKRAKIPKRNRIDGTILKTYGNR